MNLEEAIEWLIGEKELNEGGDMPNAAKAIQLGIEALEREGYRRASLRRLGREDEIKPLPSEEEK